MPQAARVFRVESVEPPPSPRTAPAEEEILIPARDGRWLGATHFAGLSGAPLVIVNGATGVRQRFYHPFARHLAWKGLEVLTYDYRGIGASRHEDVRRDPATMSDWGRRDFEAVLSYVRLTLGRPAAHVVGHSVGGQLLGFAESAGMVQRVVAVGAQLGDYRLWPMPARLKLALLCHVAVPAILRAYGYLPRWVGLGEELPTGVALEWRKWCVTPGFFGPYLRATERARFAQLRASMLVFSVEGDAFASVKAVDAWQRLFESAEVQRKHLRDKRIGHFGFFKPDLGRTQWDEVAAFLRG